MLALRLLAALMAVFCWGALALWWIGRGSHGMAATSRLSAAVCVVFWVWAASFQALALSHVFALWLVVPAWVVLPGLLVWIGRRPIGREIQSVAESLRDEWRALAAELRRHPWISAVLSAVAAHLTVRLARAVVTPSFGWDDFTYHLYRAARWVQEGGLVLEPAPDAWTYYEFFPWGGDLIWAWTLVWGLGDALVPWVACGIWAASLLAAYALARRLGQRPLIGLLVASAIALMPSQLSQIQTAYVDNVSLFLALAATLFIVERDRIGAEPTPRQGTRPEHRSWLMLGMSCGLGVLVKVSFAPIAAVAGLLSLGFAAANRRLAPLVAFVVGASIALPNLAFNWIQRGSPFYPFPIPGFSAFLPFNDQLSETLAAWGADPFIQVLGALMSLVADSWAHPFMNLGWSAVILLTVGLVGARRISGRPGGAIYLLWCFSGVALTVLHLVDPAHGSSLTVWRVTLGRLIAPSLAAWMVLAGLVDERPVRALLVAAVAAEYFVYAPWTWPDEIWVPTAILLGWAALCAIALGPGMRRIEGRLRLAAFVAALASTLALARGLHSAYRYDAYRLFAEERLDDVHRAEPTKAWPAWRLLDGDRPVTIAATAGWDLAGHNWFRYPLLGSRLQNRVVYVPVTADGAIVSYVDPDALRAVGDRRAWLDRLARAEVDWVLVMSPSIEGDWIRELPGVFEIDSSLELGDRVLARVDRQHLTAALGAAE